MLVNILLVAVSLSVFLIWLYSRRDDKRFKVHREKIFAHGMKILSLEARIKDLTDAEKRVNLLMKQIEDVKNEMSLVHDHMAMTYPGEIKVSLASPLQVIHRPARKRPQIPPPTIQQKKLLKKVSKQAKDFEQ